MAMAMAAKAKAFRITPMARQLVRWKMRYHFEIIQQGNVIV
jgi:hypothetical protein